MSEMTVEQRVAQVQERRVAAQRGQAQAQHSFDVADAEARVAAQALNDEFGVTSVQDAERLLAGLRTDVDNKLAEVESMLAGREAHSG